MAPDPIIMPKGDTPFLSLRPRNAARALDLSERALWAATAPRGPIPCVRLGGCVLYPVAALQAFLAQQAAAPAPSEGRAGQ